MKALIGTKLLNLKDCVGYTKILIFHETPSYFLIYERFDKISLVVVYMYGDISDFNFYNIIFEIKEIKNSGGVFSISTDKNLPDVLRTKKIYFITENQIPDNYYHY